MNQKQSFGQIVILNGVPRSGKSSIAAALQDRCEGVWINLGVDRSMASTPARFLPGIGLRPGGERPDLEPLVSLLYRALYESLAAYSRLGINVVADVGHHDAYSVSLGILPRCARILSGLPALLVGVHCPLEVLLERRRQSGWDQNAADPASAEKRVKAWMEAVHSPGIYDLEVDTSVLSPEACAERIVQAMATKAESSAVERLAKSIPSF